MGGDKKIIECIVKFDDKGNLEPIRFRFEDEEGTHVIQITKIVEKDLKNGFGNMNGHPVKQFTFRCESIIEGLVVPFRLLFDSNSCRWHLM
ncbi:MAG: hypothetical protein K0S75_1452 [Clostridia bacterium]|jgi:hypothetical protein|nr:hypothetical protein [Clostridia bacterium]